MLSLNRNGRKITVAGVATSLAFFLFRRLRRYCKGGQFTENVSAEGKIVVITGANSGIGLETAKELNLRGAKVYMLCRFESRANAAQRKMVKAGCDINRLIYIHCDLCSFASVRRCAAELANRESHIDILINNAGVDLRKYVKTEDGHGMEWQTNYLGPFLLTELLLPKVESARKGRIINVANFMHELYEKTADPLSINLGTIDIPVPYSDATNAKSKLANIMHACELSRRLRARGNNSATVNSLHPGVALTELERYDSFESQIITKILGVFIFKKARDGAQTSLYLALSSQVDGVTGAYFKDCARSKMASLAKDLLACEQLYDYSLRAVGLAPRDDTNK